MKKAFTIFAVVAGLFALSDAAFGSQNILAFIAKNFTGGGAALLNVEGTGALLNAQGALAINNVSGAAVSVKTGTSRLVEVSVITAGSATGSAYDVVLPASAAAANQVMTIPNTVGLYQIDWPMTNGIVVTPGTGQVLSVKYN